MKVPSYGVLFLTLYAYPALTFGQEKAITPETLTPHQAASDQIASCLTEADQRIAMLAEQLRELKTQRARLATLTETQRTQNAYREETERLRLSFSQHSNAIATLEDALSKVTRQKSRFEGELISSRNEADTRIAELQKKWQADLATSKQRGKKEQDALQELRKSNVASDTRIADLEKQLAKLPTAEADRARLAKELETATQQLQKNKVASSTRVADLENRLTTIPTLEADTTRLTKELETAKRLRTDRETQLAEKTRELERLRAEMAKGTQERLALGTSTDDLRKRFTTLTQEKEATEIKLTEALRNRDTTSEELNRISLVHRESLNTLTREQEKWLLTEQALTDTLTQEQVTQVTLSRNNETLIEELEEARRRLAASSKGAGDQSAALQQAKAELAKSQEQLRAAEAAIESAKTARARLASDQAKQTAALQVAQNDTDSWKFRFAELEKRFTSGNADSEKELIALREQAKAIGPLETELARLREQAKAKNPLEDEFAALQAKAKQDQADLIKLQEDAKAARDRVQALTQAQSNTKNDATASEKALAALKKQLADRDNTLSTLQLGLTDKEKAWQQTRITYQTEQKRLQDELAAARKAQATMQSDFIAIDPIRYELNSSLIDDEQARVLGQVQKILSIYPTASFEISGHTCTRGTDAGNKTLSEQRALRLLNFLSSNGVNRSRLSSEGFGESRPIASNDIESERRKNRRVEIRVKSADGRTLLDTEGQSRR